MLHIDLPTRAEIEQLASHRASPALSIYMRTTPFTDDTDVERLELKNLLKLALAQMEAADMPKRSIWPIQESVEALVEDQNFWAEQANSLAIFVTPDHIRTFRLPNKLTNIVEVSDRFHLKPLIRSVAFPHDAFVLAISAGAVRLVEVSADLPPHEVRVPGLPRDAGDALGRSSSQIPRSADMQGSEATSESATLTRYARAVDQALRPVLAGQEQPLIIAAAEPMASIFRRVTSYPHVAEQGIPGNADQTPEHELAPSAREVLDAIYAARIKDLGALYATREAQGRATTDIAHAARAATFGAVDTLIFDMDAVVPGMVDDDGKITFADQADAVNYGVVDEIARRALQSGARLLAARRADVIGGGDLAAILRYPI